MINSCLESIKTNLEDYLNDTTIRIVLGEEISDSEITYISILLSDIVITKITTENVISKYTVNLTISKLSDSLATFISEIDGLINNIVNYFFTRMIVRNLIINEFVFDESNNTALCLIQVEVGISWKLMKWVKW